jgi:4-amino-4-deoxy-L-arabinose transferase-like glycosyltransferase
MATVPPAQLELGHVSGLGARARRLVRGRAGEGAWVRPALAGVLVLTAILYVWGLGRNGYANTYYSAAVQAGTQSWKAFFFGALDAGSFITVDKPPASLWLMALSGRVFGFSSWSMLLPEALLGVASVGVLFATVRRAAGPVAGLVAASVMALTPVGVLMFRFNNPDALLTFLLVASAWALLRAVESGRTRWLLLSAAIVGLAFLTKYLQAYIVLPALVATYFLLGPGTVARRFVQLLGAAGALLVSSGWWVAVVSLVPASSRPFVGGSTDDSVLNLVFGYDGFGRITGALGSFGRGAASGAAGATRSFGGGGGPGGAGGFGGQPGIGRLFNGSFGGEISWLLPLAGAALLIGLWAHRRRPRPNVALASVVLWGGWLLTHAVVFSFASGIVHPYYAVVMAPALGGLIGPGVVDLWRLGQRSLAVRAAGAAALLVTAWWGDQLLARTPDFLPWLGPLEVALAVVAAVALLVPGSVRSARRLMTPALAAGMVAVLLGPSVYAVQTIGRAESGSIPTSGPASASADRFGGGGAPPGFVRSGRPAFVPGGGGGPGGGGAAFGRNGGGANDPALISYLEAHQGSATWLVAVSSANSGASIQLATGRPVLAMGGFSGSDPAMTVARLQQLVASGQLRYVLVGGFGGPGGGDGSTQAVTTWITQHGRAVNYSGSGSSSLYDLSGAAGT